MDESLLGQVGLILGLNQRYKGRAVEITAVCVHHHQLANSYTSSSSTMSGLPAGPYYIYANIPTAGHKYVGATILDNENHVLLAVLEQRRAVS
jgi:hypothetical protein